MARDRVVKCPHCLRVFMQAENDICPYCHKDIKEGSNFINFFKDIVNKDKN